MGQLRTANKRHKRAILAVQARKQAAASADTGGSKVVEARQ
jgi:hypothetical protein